jgi:large subunit ribosomal protein L16
MGSGKGAVDHYVAVVRPGTVLFEMGGIEKEVAAEAMKRAAAKLPIETRFISLEG